jgi:hypothetical protein
VIGILAKRIKTMNLVTPQVEFIDKHQAAKILGVQPGTLKKYRKEEKLIEGVHFVRLSAQAIRYNKVLIEDLVINWNDPLRHQQVIANYLASLPGNRKSRKAS